jgi:LPS sulfotransferase NodH
MSIGSEDQRHMLEDDTCELGVKRYNPELEQWEYFQWSSQQWVPSPFVEKGEEFLEVSYEETWADPVGVASY